MALEFTDANFQEEGLDSGKLVVVDFWAQWCGPCRKVAPIMDELAEEYAENVVVGKMDTAANKKVPFNYGVRSLPTVVLVKDGEIVEKIVGAKTKKAYQEAIEKHV